MPAWFRKLTGRASRTETPIDTDASPVFKADMPPAFETRLAVESPGAPGRVAAEAMYSKWAARWQEF